jgi:hypothetical protein
MQDFDDIYEAARAVVKALGGAAAVGKRLWPKMPVKTAEGRMLDSTNRNRSAKLDPEELLQLAKWGRETGCHALVDFINADTGYEPTKPVVLTEQLARLQIAAMEAQRRAEAASADLRVMLENPRLVAMMRAAHVNTDGMGA